MAPGCSMERRHADGDSYNALGAILLRNLGSCHSCGCYLTRTTYLNIVADQLHPFMKMCFPGGFGFFQ